MTVTRPPDAADPPFWAPTDDGIVVSVRVVPGARRSALAGAEGGRLRIRLAAPPVEGRANEELLRFVAARFGVRRRQVALVRGERSREKAVAVAGIDRPPEDLLSDD